jgi:predicted MFS family arabinose efflux permease
MGRNATVAALGAAQTLAWASSYYLPAILAAPMAAELGVSIPTVFAAFSLALAVSALVGAKAGAAIDRMGGRPVLVATSLVFALGLVALGASQGLYSLLAAWVVLGVAMGCGLYDSAFAALVRLYGKDARSSITGVTLIAGFASTVGWPVTALLEANFDWRVACFVWAAMHLVVGLPLNALLPDIGPEAGEGHATKAQPAASAAPEQPGSRAPLLAAVSLGFVFAATSFTSTAMAAHLPGLMAAAGASAATSVLVASLIGPAQVAARLLEFGLMRKVNPLLSARVAVAMHPVGAVALVAVGPVAAPVFGVLHGAGNGLMTIAKGTLPLSIFGPQGYGRRQGLLVAPARVSQALAPWLFGLLLASWNQWALLLTMSLGTVAMAVLLMLRVASRGEMPAETARPTLGTPR